MNRRRALFLTVLAGGGASDAVAPTLTISVVSVTGNVAAMQIVASEEVNGFAVGDITISAGGSLASFETADNITFTVSWTLAAGANTMDINAGVCEDAAGNENTVATQYALVYLVLQPDATAGADAMIIDIAADTNFGTNALILSGQSGQTNRSFIKFDLSSIPAGSTVLSVIMSLYATLDQAALERTKRVFRVKRAWAEAQVNWNSYITGNAWQTAGGFGVNDCEQTDIGSRVFTATETVNQFKDFTLTASKIQEMIDGVFINNGFLLKTDTEDSDSYSFASSDNATAGNRPKLGVVYRP